ncbi:MAG: hypothetical protein WCA35_23645 [Kovacikia sp.]
MSDSMKDRVTADFQKVKEEERTRSARVQKIIKDAFSEAASEVKQGSGEIRLIVKETLSAVVEKLDDNREATAEVGGNQPQASAQIKFGRIVQSLKNRLVAYLQQEYATLSRQSAGLKDRLSPLQTKFTERYGDRVAEAKTRIADLDAKLVGRYGDRYTIAKQRLENFKLWYGDTLVQAESVGPGLLQQKQAKFEGEVVANAGISVAKQEQQIKQRIKQFIQTTVTKL